MKNVCLPVIVIMLISLTSCKYDLSLGPENPRKPGWADFDFPDIVVQGKVYDSGTTIILAGVEVSCGDSSFNYTSASTFTSIQGEYQLVKKTQIGVKKYFRATKNGYHSLVISYSELIDSPMCIKEGDYYIYEFYLYKL